MVDIQMIGGFNGMDYKIITNGDIEEFENAVARAMEDGWKPQGGVSWQSFGYTQALILEDKNDS